jgi:Na+/H+-dicarboxylate symporter
MARIGHTANATDVTPGETVLDQHIQAFTPEPRRLAQILTLAMVTYGLGLWFRYAVIENRDAALSCAGAMLSARCALIYAVIQLFNNGIFGIIATTSASFAVIRPSNLALAAALITTAIGLALYNTGLSSFALAITVLMFARPAR